MTGIAGSITYGLARVSTEEQNEERQVLRMLALGIERKNIVVEKESGKSTVRTKYRNLVKKLKKGDTLYIENIDRLSRDYDGILKEWYILTVEKGVIIKVLDTPILDTDQTDNSLLTRFIRNILLHILAYQAENEWHKIKTRQAQGIAVAKANGKPCGRPKAVRTKEELNIARQYLNDEIALDIALAMLGKKKSAFYSLCQAVSEIQN
ncbi:MAG: recombinase family protein [Oscillospiraceae bacterium]|jgi:DNA invertase Pin-like site-specific DNA recombinase|nr:recombinase family protein [Oscillospiraceae bacterium]